MLIFLQLAFKWAAANWRPLLAALLVLVFFAAGWQNGHNRAVAACAAREAQAEQAALARENAMQALVNDISEKFEAERTARLAEKTSLEKELENERRTNPAYGSCHAGARFLQLYTAAASGSPAPAR